MDFLHLQVFQIRETKIRYRNLDKNLMLLPYLFLTNIKNHEIFCMTNLKLYFRLILKYNFRSEKVITRLIILIEDLSDHKSKIGISLKRLSCKLIFV